MLCSPLILACGFSVLFERSLDEHRQPFDFFFHRHWVVIHRVGQGFGVSIVGRHGIALGVSIVTQVFSHTFTFCAGLQL